MDESLPDNGRWQCMNCGQIYFLDNPPDICPFCRDLTTWKRRQDSAARPTTPPASKRQNKRNTTTSDHSADQLPLFGE